jgi:hypothetical protein
VAGALLVTDEDVSHGVIEHRVVRGQNRPARIPENRGNPFMNKAFPDDLCAGALRGHGDQCALSVLYQSN